MIKINWNKVYELLSTKYYYEDDLNKAVEKLKNSPIDQFDEVLKELMQ